MSPGVLLDWCGKLFVFFFMFKQPEPDSGRKPVMPQLNVILFSSLASDSDRLCSGPVDGELAKARWAEAD